MRLLVTGATGRVGSRLIPRLLQRGDAVRILIRNPEQARTLQERGAEVVVGDLLQPPTLERAVTEVDAIVHLAAFFRGATRSAAQAVNHEGTLALAEQSQRAHVPAFIYISTNLVYGPGYGRPAREDDIPRPSPDHFYPTSKLAAERALTELYQHQEQALSILRLAFVYGEDDPHLAEALNLTRSWPSAKRMQLVHHADVDQAIMLVIDKPQAKGRLYNVADNELVPISEIRKLNRSSNMDETANSVVDDPWEGIVDTARICSELGFHPIYPSVYAAQAAGAL